MPRLAQEEEVSFDKKTFPHTKLSSRLDRIIDKIGAYSSWIWIVTIGCILYSVVSRYAFGQGSVMLEEAQWHLAGIAWLIGLSYTLVHDEHVRVDVLHEKFSLKGQAWVEFLALGLLLLPFLFIVLNELIPYIHSSFQQGERSQAPNGLPYRWLIKSFLALSVVLLIVAAFSRFLRVSAFLFGKTEVRSGD